MDVSRKRIWIARGVAFLVDLLQLALLPLFVPGGVSLWDDALDVVAASILVALVGWHWAFLPSLVAEVVPGLDLFPTWTAAVWFATRKKHLTPAPLPPAELETGNLGDDRPAN